MVPVRIGQFGYGRTGQLVARECIASPGIELTWVVSRSGRPPAGATWPQGLHLWSVADFTAALAASEVPAVDVIVDFSSPLGVLAYEPLASSGTRVVSAIAHSDAAGQAALERMASQTAVLHSPNITIGINFLLVASRALQQLAPEADIAVLEEHFREKPDVSGTALRLARALELPEGERVHSIRAGGIVGRHEVIFGLPNQTLRLIHESINRAAFGRGALYAARWLRHRPPGRYSMEGAVREALVNAILDAPASSPLAPRRQA